MNFSISSSAFKNGSAIPAKHTCDGADTSPPLVWSGVNEGTLSFALICDDPDAPLESWVHWLLWNLPATSSGLPEAVESNKMLPVGTQQGQNDFHSLYYRGPCPPRGKTHRYFFKIYALDALLSLESGATKKELIKAMDGHVLAHAEWVGTCQR
jgi:Raf kinase inhibitor-like YbhB/YbcL family protein